MAMGRCRNGSNDLIHGGRWWWWWWSRSNLLRMKNVSDKICTENQNTHFRFHDLFFFFRRSCRLWENVEKCGRAKQATDTNTEWRMRYTFWVAKAADTHTHLEYILLLIFPRKRRWLESAPVLRYMYIACLVIQYLVMHLVTVMFFIPSVPVYYFSLSSSAMSYFLLGYYYYYCYLFLNYMKVRFDIRRSWNLGSDAWWKKAQDRDLWSENFT